MTLEAYPEDIEIKKRNFKTDQQEEAAETIAEAWPEDVETIAEAGPHVEMFYRQVLDQFLGPEDAELTFSEIESEHGSVEEWTGDGDSDDSDEEDVAVPDIEDIEPGTDETTSDGGSGADIDPGDLDVDALGTGTDTEEDVDARRRAWFRAGFREGIEFAADHPELFEED